MSGPTRCGCARRSSGAPGRTPRGGRDSSSLQRSGSCGGSAPPRWRTASTGTTRSEEHTSELQSLRHLVCRLLLEKKKNNRFTETKQKKNNNNLANEHHNYNT